MTDTYYNAGSLASQPYSNSTFVSPTFNRDFYRFSVGTAGGFNLSLTGMSADADISLYRDSNNNGVFDSSDTYVLGSSRFNNADESINLSSLETGNYLAMVSRYSGDTSNNYTLRLSNSNPSNLLPTEVNVGALSGTRTFADSVGSSDTADTYRFSLGTSSNFNLSMRGLSADADVRLIRDGNSNGIIDSGEEVIRAARGGSADESINLRSLTAGSYIAQVYQYSGNTNYSLDMSTTAAYTPSNLVSTEVNVGALSSTQTFSDLVNGNDTADTYRFSLGASSSFNLSLTGMSADADVRLIRDGNNNGIVDSGEELARSARGGAADDSINLRSLAAGSYIAQVYQHSGDTSYSLKMSTTSPSNLLPTEVNVGALSGTRTFADAVNNSDTIDTYRFSLSSGRNVNFSLSGLSADADIRLVRDGNNNGILDSGEVLGQSARAGSVAESINTFLSSGNYIAEVYQFSGDTNYTLSLSA
ncbi:pre-peptidase C-terminal domain-containing protein [Leptolyngbya sp. FACHB-261]|uniref:pre-peptidase C-terminal domain-containing protein n=1 Tax=Leptolyngbya sp. FACHB-261 TaxID=2692806 RepID=UPI001685EA31|nr:pre-peptidase C-terminal domain-containing protein [Leptolyngbya sp. FACHB-261]MBD2103740.1 PPC domain-containing protein [Leptolyngbya sp. FACHB-261]